MYYNSNNHSISFTETDYSKLTRIIKHLIHQVDMPQLGLYSTINPDELWISLIFQFCTVSGKRMTEDLREDEKRLIEFGEKLNFRLLSSMKNNREEYISNVLKKYKATSFYNKQAERIEDVLNSRNVIDKNQFILLNDIDHNRQNYEEIRGLLMTRVPHFKIKSASGFMIENGLSIDIIEISTRIGEVLNRHFNLNLDHRKIQTSRKTYEIIENALRKACNRLGIPLACLSRMLFYYSEKDTISYILEDL